VLPLKEFRRKQAIPSLINLSFQITIRLSLLQKTRVQPFKIVLVNFQLDHN